MIYVTNIENIVLEHLLGQKNGKMENKMTKISQSTDNSDS